MNGNENTKTGPFGYRPWEFKWCDRSDTSIVGIRNAIGKHPFLNVQVCRRMWPDRIPAKHMCLCVAQDLAKFLNEEIGRPGWLNDMYRVPPHDGECRMLESIDGVIVMAVGPIVFPDAKQGSELLAEDHKAWRKRFIDEIESRVTL